MNRHWANLASGLGSILEVFPKPQTRRFIPKDSDGERLYGDLKRVGQDMNRSLGKLKNGSGA